MRTIRVAAAVCGVLALLLGLPFAGGSTPSALDAAFASAIAHLGPTAARVLLVPTEPYVVLALAAVAVVLCLRRGRRFEAGLALAGPLLALALTGWVVKPLYGRWKNDTLVYPSGHTVGLVSVLTVLVLITRRALVAVLAALALLAATAGLVGMGYHYVTDVVGGALFAAAVTGLTWTVPRPARVPSGG